MPDRMAVASRLSWLGNVALISKPPVKDAKLSEDSSHLTSLATGSPKPALFSRLPLCAACFAGKSGAEPLTS